jgi:hypothetical protein
VPAGFPPYTYNWAPTNETTASITVSPDVTTSYTVTIKNAFGCATTATEEIQVIDISDGDKDKVFICHEGNTISVSVNAVPAHLAHGDLLGNCAVNRSPLSKITMEPNADIVSVYPNPANTTAIINIKLVKESKVDISVVDASGRKALGNIHRNLNAGSNQVKLDVSSLLNGIYMVEVNKNNTKTIQKLIIRH